MDLHEQDAPPEPFFRRRSTLVVSVLAGAVLAIAGLWWNSGRTSRTLDALASRGAFDSAWTLLREEGSGEVPCVRAELAARLGLLDPRTDTILVLLADSLRTCRIPRPYLFELAAKGHYRIMEHAAVGDSEAVWRLQSNAFRAASDCVAADSLDLECQLMGFQALRRMGDTIAQRNWIENALSHAPHDTALLARRAMVGAAPARAGKPAPAPR